MSTTAWILIIWLGLNAVYQVLLIGKHRDPKSPFEGLLGVVEIGVAAWLVLILAGVL